MDYYRTVRFGHYTVVEDIVRGEELHRIFSDARVLILSAFPVFSTRPTEFAYLVAVGAVIGVIDEIDGDDPRPRAVEDRHGQLHEQEVSSEFKPASIKRVESLEDGIVAGSFVVLGTDLSNGALIDASKDNGGPDVARIEGRALNPWQGKLSDHIPRHIFDDPCRKEASSAIRSTLQFRL